MLLNSASQHSNPSINLPKQYYQKISIPLAPTLHIIIKNILNDRVKFFITSIITLKTFSHVVWTLKNFETKILKTILLWLFLNPQYFNIFSQLCHINHFKVNNFRFTPKDVLFTIKNIYLASYNITGLSPKISSSSDIFESIFPRSFSKTQYTESGTLDFEIYTNPKDFLVTYILSIVLFNIESQNYKLLLTYNLLNTNTQRVILNLLWILSTLSNSWIFWIHNLNFDLYFILEAFYLWRSLIKTSKAISITRGYHNSKIYYLKILRPQLNITFYCSYILLEASLNTIRIQFLHSNKIGFPKKSSIPLLNSTLYSLEKHCNTLNKHKFIGFLYNLTTHKNNLNLSITYCLIDSYLLSEIVLLYISELKKIYFIIFKIRHTLTSTKVSFSFFFNTGYSEYNNLPLISIKSASYPELKDGYVGGRTEVIQLKEAPNHKIYYYDFPGIYALAIQTLLPIGSIVRSINPNYTPQNSSLYTTDILKDLGSTYTGFFKITLKSNNSSTHLPTSHLKSCKIISSSKNLLYNKLLFLNGTFTNFFYKEELEHALNLGSQIIQLHDYVIYNAGYPFASYISNLNSHKTKYSSLGNSAIKKIYKNLVNILYGRFALHINSTSIQLFQRINELKNLNKKLNTDRYRLSLLKLLRIPSYSGLGIWTKDSPLTNHINIGIASAITSIARIILHKSVIKLASYIPEAKIIYIDTDSIFVSSPHLPQNCTLINKENFSLFHPSCRTTTLKWNNTTHFDTGFFIVPKIYFLWKEKLRKCSITSKGIIFNNNSQIILLFTTISKQHYNLNISLNLTSFIKFHGILPSLTFESAIKNLQPFSEFKRQLLINKSKISPYTLPHRLSMSQVTTFSRLSTINSINIKTLKNYIKTKLLSLKTSKSTKKLDQDFTINYIECKIHLSTQQLSTQDFIYTFKTENYTSHSSTLNKLKTRISLFILTSYCIEFLNLHYPSTVLSNLQIGLSKTNSSPKNLLFTSPSPTNLYKHGLIEFTKIIILNTNIEQYNSNNNTLIHHFISIYINHPNPSKHPSWSFLTLKPVNSSSVSEVLSDLISLNLYPIHLWPKTILKLSNLKLPLIHKISDPNQTVFCLKTKDYIDNVNILTLKSLIKYSFCFRIY